MSHFDDETFASPGSSIPSPPVEGFSKFALPLIKRIYPQLIADKLVSVEPLFDPAKEIPVDPPKSLKYRSIDEPWDGS